MPTSPPPPIVLATPDVTEQRLLRAILDDAGVDSTAVVDRDAVLEVSRAYGSRVVLGGRGHDSLRGEETLRTLMSTPDRPVSALLLAESDAQRRRVQALGARALLKPYPVAALLAECTPDPDPTR